MQNRGFLVKLGAGSHIQPMVTCRMSHPALPPPQMRDALLSPELWACTQMLAGAKPIRLGEKKNLPWANLVLCRCIGSPIENPGAKALVVSMESNPRGCDLGAEPTGGKTLK